MIKKVAHRLLDFRDRQRIAIALAKGAATSAKRRIDPAEPASWEFSGFSQNGEDGIIDVLRGNLREKNRYVIEIGSADGLENNSAWLVIAEKYSGLLIEGDRRLWERATRMVTPFSIGVECVNQFVNLANIETLLSRSFYQDPDVFSLDIDGNDFYIAKAILSRGFRPKIFIVEFNSVYGPERAVTIRYQKDFSFAQAHSTQLYYGVSIRGWQRLFEKFGYRFITVDQNGVNAFFVDPGCLSPEFLSGIRGLDFAENRYQRRKFHMSTDEQFRLIAAEQMVEIDSSLLGS
jgi:hypothetical protein